MAVDYLRKLSKDEKLYQESLTREISLVIHNLDRVYLLKEGMEKRMSTARKEGKL
ncbi:MAG: hypothetical protein OXJ52_00375 [Oligoflexia bacterium]|nr:hypothetical protein [Oligoflexia bacterium]